MGDIGTAVVGLGYVGLPLAVALAKTGPTVGIDIDAARVAELRAGHDRTREINRETLAASTLAFADGIEAARGAGIIIVTVPTPIDYARAPDLGPLLGATRSLATVLEPGAGTIIVYESTVYPGVTEDICGPEIERISGCKRGIDFFLGYSPERINPGDREHTVERITKVVAGETAHVTGRLAELYGRVTSGGTFRAASIKAAEAAKVIENAQRDVNIAFINEITQIFGKLDISIWDVLDAAATKWNFLPFQPGLVGGHCIGVDPYYLSHRAQQLGHDPRVILSGRSINDGMGEWVADRIHERLRAPAGGAAGDAGGPGATGTAVVASGAVASTAVASGAVASGAASAAAGMAAARAPAGPARILMLGLTFKENVPDLRNSKVVDVIRRLEWLGHAVTVHDPLADPAEAMHEYGLMPDAAALDHAYAAVVLAVPHEAYRTLDATRIATLLAPGALLVDLKRFWPADTLPPGTRRWTL